MFSSIRYKTIDYHDNNHITCSYIFAIPKQPNIDYAVRVEAKHEAEWGLLTSWFLGTVDPLYSKTKYTAITSPLIHIVLCYIP